MATPQDIVEGLKLLHAPGAVNIYDEGESVTAGDRPGDATVRCRNVLRYLTAHWSARVVLVGEAPGQRGCRLSGVPFTSLRQLTGSGPSEKSATIVHGILRQLGVEREVLLWNASMLFPPGNRDPLPAELAASRGLLRTVCNGRTVYAVGRFAADVTGAPYIRHPSRGGKPRFSEAMNIIFQLPPGADIPRKLAQIAAQGPVPSSFSRPGHHGTDHNVCAVHHLVIPLNGICDLCVD